MKIEEPSIVLLEDDYSQIKKIKIDLERIGIEHVHTVDCESAFIYESRTEVWGKVDIFILDLMVEWRKRGNTNQLERDEDHETGDEAGLRSLAIAREKYPDAIAILWSVTDQKMPDGLVDENKVFYYVKDSSMEGDLGEIVSKLLSGEKDPPPSSFLVPKNK